jgi:tetratricopeptide (TPR) repeat protein
LKEDPFAQSAAETIGWAAAHRNALLGVALVAAVVALVAFGGWYYLDQQETKANLEFGAALRTLSAPVTATPAPGETETYLTAQARSQAAEKKFQAVADHYRYTKTGEMARYMIAVAHMESGDNAEAEKRFKEVAGSGNKDVASLANMALASIYASTGRQAEAINIYKSLIDHPTNTVSKPEAQMALAGLYADSNPAEARKIYLQMETDDPTGPLAQLALSKIAALKK